MKILRILIILLMSVSMNTFIACENTGTKEGKEAVEGDNDPREGEGEGDIGEGETDDN